MTRLSMTKGLLTLLVSTQLWSQTSVSTNDQQTRIRPNGEAYVLEASDAKASKLPPGSEQFPILETGSKGEAKADVHRVVLERTFETPKRIRVKMKVPLFKYKPIMSGSNFYVETTKEIRDSRTGQVIRVKDYQKKRLMWCGLEPCLMSSEFLLQACVKVGSNCSSAYDEIIIDFSKAQNLEIGETEEFFVSAYQRKIPGKAIDFLVHPIPGRIKAPRYIIERRNPLFGPDVYVVRLPNKYEIAAENKKNTVEPKDVLDLEAAVELNKNTRYTTLPVNMGLPGQQVPPNGQGQVSGQGQEVEELCLDEMGRIKSRKTVIEGAVNNDHVSRDQVLIHNKKAESSVSSVTCRVRRDHLVLEESLAGQKGAIDRGIYLKNQAVNIEESSTASGDVATDLEIDEE